MEINNAEIGKRLNKARKDKDLTMKELGLLVNLHESSVQRYIVGLVKNVSIEKLKEFAKVLDIEASYLIGWKDKELVVVSNDKKDLHGFTVNLVEKLLAEGIIDDKNDIPQHIIDAIINALKIDSANKKKH